MKIGPTGKPWCKCIWSLVVLGPRCQRRRRGRIESSAVALSRMLCGPRAWLCAPLQCACKLRPIVGQPSDSDLTRLWEAVTPLLLHIPYDETGAVHNLIGLIWPEAAYVSRYGKAFPKATRVRAYDKTIDDDAMAVVRARTKSSHKAKRVDRATYKTA